MKAERDHSLDSNLPRCHDHDTNNPIQRMTSWKSRAALLSKRYHIDRISVTTNPARTIRHLTPLPMTNDNSRKPKRISRSLLPQIVAA
jgi:hypothetical protein